jgi:hypothetical protein
MGLAYAAIILMTSFFAQELSTIQVAQRAALGLGLGLMAIGALDGTSYLRKGTHWRDGHWWLFVYAFGAPFSVVMILAFWTTPDAGFILFMAWGLAGAVFGIILASIRPHNPEQVDINAQHYNLNAPIFERSAFHRAMYFGAPLVFIVLLGALYRTQATPEFTLYMSVFFATIQSPFHVKATGWWRIITPYTLGILIAVIAIFYW